MEGLHTHTWLKSHNYSLQVVHTPTQMEAHIKSPSLTPYATFGNQSVPPVSNWELYIIKPFSVHNFLCVLQSKLIL